MSMQRQIGFWFAFLASFALFLHAFSGILMPFVAALILAYLLDPLVDKLEKWRISRLAATCLVLVVFILLFVVLLLAVMPLLFDQFAAFILKAPGYAARLQQVLMEQGLPLFERFGGADRLKEVQGSLANGLGEGAKWLGGVVTSLVSGGGAILGVFSLLVLTPIIAFYMILDWDHMVARVDGWIPRQHKETVRSLISEMDRSVAGFMRGQAILSLLLGMFYAIALSLAGLNFGFLIGIFAGILSFIPYVGSVTGLVVSVSVAIAQFWPDWGMVLLIAGIFAAGQFVEGNFLQPKLLGDAVGLHPVWLIFSLLGAGSLFGFVGVLLAVPLAAMIGVLVRFGLRRYLASALYHGGKAHDDKVHDGTVNDDTPSPTP